MNDKRQEIERILTEIEQELATGSTLDPTVWVRRYPELQPELGELLAEMVGRPSTVLPPNPGPGEERTVAGLDQAGGTGTSGQQSAIGMEATVALGHSGQAVPSVNPGPRAAADPRLMAGSGSAASDLTV